MRKNLGSVDCWMRGILGLGIAAAIALEWVLDVWRWPLGLLGFALLLTVAMQRDPLYGLFGMNTRR